jgi:hypothetical protein
MLDANDDNVLLELIAEDSDIVFVVYDNKLVIYEIAELLVLILYVIFPLVSTTEFTIELSVNALDDIL